VGLIKELLLLPLAPVRGTVWVAEQIAAEAERQLDPRAARRRELVELERRLTTGEIDEEEFDRLEDEILRAYPTTTSGGSRHGGLDDEKDAKQFQVPFAQHQLSQQQLSQQQLAQRQLTEQRQHEAPHRHERQEAHDEPEP
jgi:hypothetical protein